MSSVQADAVMRRRVEAAQVAGIATAVVTGSEVVEASYGSCPQSRQMISTKLLR